MPTLLYVHNLSPFLFRFQLWGLTFGLRWYGLAYVAGLCGAFYSFRHATQRGFLPELNTDARRDMIAAVTVGVVGGGRLGYVLQHPRLLLADPLSFFRVWEGGMAFFGGLIGVVAALAWTARRFGVSFWTLADVAAFPAAFGLGVGRIANFINGELWGRPTGANWGVIFPRVDYVPRHPSQLYEAVSHFLLFGILALVLRYRSQTVCRPGTLAALFLSLYGGLRFLTDFYRADDTFIGPFSSGQWASLTAFVIGTTVLTRKKHWFDVDAASLATTKDLERPPLLKEPLPKDARHEALVAEAAVPNVRGRVATFGALRLQRSTRPALSVCPASNPVRRDVPIDAASARDGTSANCEPRGGEGHE